MQTAAEVLEDLWNDQNLSSEALSQIKLTGADPVFPSSFAVGAAAQASMAAAAGMAALTGSLRGLPKQSVSVDMMEAAIECTGHFTLDGKATPKFAELSGLYLCRDGWLRIHANFDHHRDAALTVLGLTPGPDTPRADVEQQALNWNKQSLEDAIVDNNGACAAVRTFTEWDALPQAQAVAKLPLVEITKTGDAKPETLESLSKKQQPLTGVRVLDLTRILAGPVCGRTLAAYGADVMLVNSPELPNIDSIIETSRGKRSTHLNLQQAADKEKLHQLIAGAHVFVQGYRPGSLAALGLTPEALAAEYPGIVYTSLSAYGRTGPWSTRRGYDSLLQSASGINMAEAQAKDTDIPTALPMQILDYATGFLMAFGTQVALQKQLTEGGSWHVQVSLARTSHWLRSLGQSNAMLDCSQPDPQQYLQKYNSSYGNLQALPHPPRFSHTPVRWIRPSEPPGTHPATW